MALYFGGYKPIRLAKSKSDKTKQYFFRRRTALLALLASTIISGIASPMVSAAGPYWRVGGVRLEQGKKQVKIALAQGEAEFKWKVLGLNTVISCATVVVQNGYIEGNGTNQGQGAVSSIALEKCKTQEPGKCLINEPIKTGQLKSHLVEYTNSAAQLKIGELFEPSQATSFFELEFKDKSEAEKCAIKGTRFIVAGEIVAEVFPENQETQKGYLVFPDEPIHKVKHEGQEVSTRLSVGGVEAKLVGIFEARLAPVTLFGAFTT